MSLEEDRERYMQALHGVQCAIGFELGLAGQNISHPKHLRTMAKNAHYAERELLGYEAKYPGVHFR